MIGWEEGSVVDQHGKPLQFSIETCMKMPEDWLVEFSQNLGLSSSDDFEEEAKNLEGTSNSES